MNGFFKRVGVCVLVQWMMIIAVSATQPVLGFVLEKPSPKWGPSPQVGTTGGTVDWTILPAGETFNVGGSTFISTALDVQPRAGLLTPAQIDHQINRAFDTYQAAANINFEEVAYVPKAPALHVGEITLGAHSFGASNKSELAYTLYSIGPNDAISADIQFNSDWLWESGNALGNLAVDLYSVALHEIGHALGLAHDTTNVAVMNPIISTSTVYTGLFADDLAGIQYLYGKRGNSTGPVTPPPPVYKQTGSADVRLPEPSTYLLLGAFLLVAVMKGPKGHKRHKGRKDQRDEKR